MWHESTSPESAIERGVILSADGTVETSPEDVGDLALPVYEGRMISQYSASAKGWVSGKGRRAKWRTLAADDIPEPQFLMSAKTYAEHLPESGSVPKIGFMDITAPTNTRTMIATVLPSFPCIHKVPTLTFQQHRPSDAFGLLAVLNSYPFDWALRRRLGGLSLAWFVVAESIAVVERHVSAIRQLGVYAARLSMPTLGFARVWLALARDLPEIQLVPWRMHWAVTAHERLRVRTVVDAVAAEVFGMTLDDFSWVMRGCDHPRSWLASKPNTRTLDTKGFWRQEMHTDAELRHTVLAQVAFQDLKRDGLEAFLSMNNGEGWMVPETLRLADYGLGHDARAHEPQPVASELGPRFYHWQCDRSAEESWRECELHADLIRRIDTVTESVREEETVKPAGEGNGPPRDLFGNPLETDLFGDAVPPPPRRRR